MDISHPLYSSPQERAKALEEDYKLFLSECDEFWKKDNDMMGLVLKCHLIVEYYMTECLKTSLPGIDKFDEARLSFAQKHHLLTGWTFGFPWLKNAVADLNRLRNKVAHRINHVVTDQDLQPIYDAMDPSYLAKKEPVKRGREALIDFANLVSMALSGWSKEIARHAPETGSAGYNQKCMEWYEKQATEFARSKATDSEKSTELK